MVGIAILGATGSIGRNALDVIARHPERFKVIALTAHKDSATLFEQCQRFKPDYAVMSDHTCAKQLEQLLKNSTTRVLAGPEALSYVATLPEVDKVLAGIVGAPGLLSTLAAAQAGKTILLANKEALIMSGELLLKLVEQSGAALLPVDSEHNAIFQCMPPGYRAGQTATSVRKIILTASGGPFRDSPLESLKTMTPEQACDHPNWKMGRKISVDCATMLNKGLEVIEAYWLFKHPLDYIDVILHPQSIVHSLVEYEDGSILAQLGNPDMRIPISYALAWPLRIESGAAPLDLLKAGKLDFQAMDLKRYPCLKLTYEALRQGGTANIVLNAANEIAVTAFLDGQIRFTDIATVIEKVLNVATFTPVSDLNVILEADAQARRLARENIQALSSGTTAWRNN